MGVVEEEECQLMLALSAGPNTIPACIHEWAYGNVGIQALTEAPPLLVIDVIRFTYLERHPIRIAERLQLEPSIVHIPLFREPSSIHTITVSYQLVACICTLDLAQLMDTIA